MSKHLAIMQKIAATPVKPTRYPELQPGDYRLLISKTFIQNKKDDPSLSGWFAEFKVLKAAAIVGEGPPSAEGEIVVWKQWLGNDDIKSAPKLRNLIRFTQVVCASDAQELIAADTNPVSNEDKAATAYVTLLQLMFDENAARGHVVSVRAKRGKSEKGATYLACDWSPVFQTDDQIQTNVDFLDGKAAASAA